MEKHSTFVSYFYFHRHSHNSNKPELDSSLKFPTFHSSPFLAGQISVCAIRLFVCWLFISLPGCLSVYPSVSQSVSLSIYLSVSHWERYNSKNEKLPLVISFAHLQTLANLKTWEHLWDSKFSSLFRLDSDYFILFYFSLFYFISPDANTNCPNKLAQIELI